MELLRVVESYPIEQLEKLVPLLEGESERELRLRVMNLIVPWTRGDFSKYYLQSNEELNKLLSENKNKFITRLTAIFYITALNGSISDKNLFIVFYTLTGKNTS